MVFEYQYDSSLWVYDPANAATTLDARELIDYLYVRAIISSDLVMILDSTPPSAADTGAAAGDAPL